MPPPQQRKVAFSTKRKKEQLKAKRERKRMENQAVDSEHSKQSSETENSISCETMVTDTAKDRGDARTAPNRYRLLFLNESKNEIEKRKRNARKPLPALLSQKAMEIDLNDIYKPGSVLDIPKRPSWNYTESKAQLEAKEQKYFREYVENIMKMYDTSQLSYFELNIETWRQLWRVLEMSDVILLITDVRHPGYHFSPALYNYVTQELGKDIILVLNKADLVPPALVTAWRHFFLSRFLQLKVVTFTSYPKDEEERIADSDETKVMRRRKRKRVPAVGPYQLLDVCEALVGDKVDLTSWRQKVDSANQGGDEVEGHESRVVNEEDGSHHPPSAARFHHGVLTIGCCGYPNVGKSSLINGLVGKKVVSVSRTPGHTKHFQTIYLTSSVRLCDCPGLVFPALVDKPMQVLAGIFPIAQLREPYSAIAYLACRLPLPRLLRLQYPDYGQSPTERGDGAQWSAYDICWAWAEKRGFFTAKAARPDLYRAANNILRLALEGRLCLCYLPPGYTHSKDSWEAHSDTLELARLQNAHSKVSDEDERDSQADESSEDEDEVAGAQSDDGSASDDDDGGDAPTSSVNKFDLLADDD